jgi:hypothetical protein
MRYARHALAIAALLAAAVFAWPLVAYWQQARLADRMALETLAGNPAQCNALIDELAKLGLPAVEPLVFLAACGTSQIAATAQEAVLDLATTWEIDFESRGDAPQLAERLAVLAAALDLHAGRFDAAAWPWKQRLARRVIADCEHVPASQSLAVLRCCDRALATVCPVEPAPTVAIQAPITPPLPPSSALPELLEAASLNSLRSPSGSLPIEGRVGEGVGSGHRPSSPLPNPLPQGEVTGSSAVIDAEARSIVNERGQPPVVEVHSPAETEALLRFLRRQPDRALLDKLTTATRYEAAVIRQALQRRGYSTALLNAITRLQHAGIDERRHSLEHIDSLPSADAQRVLRWFVDDPDPTLRLKALAILATSGDPRLTEIARQRAIRDADPRVAALATRLMTETK